VSLSRRIQITEKTAVKIRFDVVNILDTIYELRDGSGIGVGAPHFGQRRGFYGTVAYEFGGCVLIVTLMMRCIVYVVAIMLLAYVAAAVQGSALTANSATPDLPSAE